MRWILFILWLLPATLHADSPKFDEQIAPLFIKRCLGCHSGADAKGELDLSKKASSLGGDKPLVVPGKPDESSLWQRVEADEMPPKTPLSVEEKKLLKEWISGGAKWGRDPINTRPSADWWAFQPLAKSSVPAGSHPVDHFIHQELKARNLKPVPPADRLTLIRRLYFDLIGLPPTPQQVEAFLKDPRSDAYNRLIDELLASPHYGERWARHWLDVVHYGETHGYDKDQPRPHSWPYRDYVIRSFNSDKPYTRFVQEQIAGDKLFPNDPAAIEALGFLAAGPWDLIGHAEVPETKIDGKIARHLDRDDFVANSIGSFLSLTVHCAQCHDHKFDPISQKEYYSLQAVFAAIDRADRPYDADPKQHLRRTELLASRQSVEKQLTQLTATARQKAGAALTKLEQQIHDGNRPTKGQRPEYGYHSQLASHADVSKWVQLDFGKPVTLDTVTLRPCYDDFNNIGAGFGFPLRYKVELSNDATFKTSEILIDRTSQDQSNPGTTAINIEAKLKKGRYLRLTATKLANRLPNDYMLAIAEIQAFDQAGINQAPSSKVLALDSIEAGPRWRQTNLIDGIYPASQATAKQLESWTRRRDELLDQSLSTEQIQQRQKLEREQQQLQEEIKKLPPQKRVYVGTVHTGNGTFVGTGANGGQPRRIQLLPRGDVTKPGEEVQPGALEAIPVKFELPANATESDRRAALAKWLTHPQNPLLWRSIANRVWQYHFGRGLVDTPNDFGRMGERPTHPVLLDELARQLQQHNGSLKHLHKLILTSETYQRQSVTDATNAKVDADNRYYWRQNRRKLEAEAVRDSVLFVAGKLNLEMGGPSFRDFVVEKPEHSPHYQYHLYDPEDVRGHRRAVYRFIVRSKPQPFLASLDCADPSFSVEKRNQTITPQQALALLNNRLTVAMAKHFADRVAKQAEGQSHQLKLAFKLATSREPQPEELQVLQDHATQHGLASACRIILNLNEFVFVD